MSSTVNNQSGADGSGREPATKQGASEATPAAPLIVLHAAGWRTKADVYAALLPALGAPAWHGHNLDALNDSFVGGAINSVEPPLTLRFIGLSRASSEVRAMIDVVEEIVQSAREEGRMYEMQKTEDAGAETSISEA